MHETVIHAKVAAAREGRSDTVICRMPSGWAVLGDWQFLEGYCLLLPDPVVPTVNHLEARERERYLLDMTRIGDAVLQETSAIRINYSMLGNQVPALHAHVFARYASEDPEYRGLAVWQYPIEVRESVPYCPDRHADLRGRLARALEPWCTS